VTRLFVAIWPPEELLERLADMERPKDPGVKWVRPENLHITVRFLGDADIDEAIERLDDVFLPSATAVLGPALDLQAERSIMLPVAGVDDLAEVVEQAVRGVGSANERRRFLGHLTLARLAKKARPDRSVGRLFDAAFEVGEIALVASTLTDSGSIYETVETWPTR
jgi:RNA 2',3'-cyclic 3'-phosphodiesterase